MRVNKQATRCLALLALLAFLFPATARADVFTRPARLLGVDPLAFLFPATARADVFTRPARLLGVDPYLAMAVARVESDWHPWCVNIEGKDYRAKSLAEAATLAKRALVLGKSLDVGLMQINSYWLRKWQIPLERVLDPATNVTLGLCILKYEMRRYGSTWKAVGAYHSKNTARQKRYVQKVAQALSGIHRALGK